MEKEKGKEISSFNPELFKFWIKNNPENQEKDYSDFLIEYHNLKVIKEKKIKTITIVKLNNNYCKILNSEIFKIEKESIVLNKNIQSYLCKLIDSGFIKISDKIQFSFNPESKKIIQDSESELYQESELKLNQEKKIEKVKIQIRKSEKELKSNFLKLLVLKRKIESEKEKLELLNPDSSLDFESEIDLKLIPIIRKINFTKNLINNYSEIPESESDFKLIKIEKGKKESLPGSDKIFENGIKYISVIPFQESKLELSVIKKFSIQELKKDNKLEKVLIRLKKELNLNPEKNRFNILFNCYQIFSIENNQESNSKSEFLKFYYDSENYFNLKKSKSEKFQIFNNQIELENAINSGIKIESNCFIFNDLKGIKKSFQESEYKDFLSGKIRKMIQNKNLKKRNNKKSIGIQELVQ